MTPTKVSSLRGVLDLLLPWWVIATSLVALIQSDFHWLICVFAVIAIGRSQLALLLEGHEAIHGLIAPRRSVKQHSAGLTFPLSNILRPLSTYLVRKQEAQKKDLSMAERTLTAANRTVKMKTVFPSAFKLILNPVTLFPMYLLQLLFRRSSHSLVLYCEMAEV